MKLREHRTRDSGFSLIEIMVAVTLLSVITVGLLAMFYQTQKAFRLGANQTDVLEGARAAMDMISREVQEMYPSYMSNVVNFHAITGSTERLIMPMPGGGERTNLLQDVSFLAKRGDEWLGITYRVDDRIDTPTGRETVGLGSLYRSVIVSNQPTLRADLTVSNLVRHLLPHEPDIPANTNFHRIIDGVIHFRVYAYDQAGRLQTNRLSPSVIDVTLDRYRFFDWVPAYVDIELGIVDPKVVEQFRARSDNPVVARDFLAEQAHRMYLFKRRIPVRARHSQFDLLL